MSVRARVRQTGSISPAAAAWLGLVVAADHVTAHTQTVCEEHGITGDQYNVLRILRGSRPHGLDRGEITARLARRAPDMTRMLDRLEHHRLVRRARGVDDARRSVAQITDAGLRLLDRMQPHMETAMRDATMALTSEQLRTLAELCDALVPDS
jgi:MarR family transcriptional regulator, organic hydroperoxide resistance regulator